MPWIENFTLIMRSNLTALQDKLIDPEKMVHQLLVDMDEELVRVRHAVSKAIADEILLGKKADRARRDVALWRKRARDALDRGDEPSARAALERKLSAEELADRLTTELEKQKTQTSALQRSVGDLEEKIQAARQKQAILLARLTRAESGHKINQALSQKAGRSALTHFRALEERVDRAEALSEAYERLDCADPEGAELERQFDEDERKARLTRELEALKARLDGPEEDGE